MYNKEELTKITGGNLSGAVINAFVRVFNAFLEVGRSLGTAIRRIGANEMCGV